MKIAALVGLIVTASAVVAAPHAFQLTEASPRILTTVGLEHAQQGATRPTRSIANTLVFAGKRIRLVVVTGPQNDMLSYRICGRRNPTLVVRRGTVISLLFANTDDDMLHNVRFGNQKPPYPPIMSHFVKGSVGSKALAHRSSKVVNAEQMTILAPSTPGVWAYCCTTDGHAQFGMYGLIKIR